MAGEMKTDIDIDAYFSAALRTEYTLHNGTYFFAEPSYARATVIPNFGSDLLESNAWEVGFGIGAGVRLPEGHKIELGYAHYDGSDVLNVGVKFDL